MGELSAGPISLLVPGGFFPQPTFTLGSLSFRPGHGRHLFGDMISQGQLFLRLWGKQGGHRRLGMLLLTNLITRTEHGAIIGKSIRGTMRVEGLGLNRGVYSGSPQRRPISVLETALMVSVGVPSTSSVSDPEPAYNQSSGGVLGGLLILSPLDSSTGGFMGGGAIGGFLSGVAAPCS